MTSRHVISRTGGQASKQIACVRGYGAFFLSKFNLSLVFTSGLRFSTLRFVFFNLDIRFSTSTFVLFSLDIVFQLQRSFYSTSTFVFQLKRSFYLGVTVVNLCWLCRPFFQLQHSCYSILDIRFSDQHSFFQPQHSFLKFNIRFAAMFPVTSRLGHVELFISVVGKDTTSLDVCTNPFSLAVNLVRNIKRRRVFANPVTLFGGMMERWNGMAE